MSKLSVTGGNRLEGIMNIGGAKNAVLPILACALLTDRPVRLNNCPKISDVTNMLNILEELGCEYHYEGETLCLDTAAAHSYVMPTQLSKELRSSIFMLGAILGRFKRACCVYPGGCEIGNRPIDLHLSGLMRINVGIEESNGIICCDGTQMRGAEVYLDYPSVGATENIMMAATAAEGVVRITNAAREPEIEDLQGFMRVIGFDVRGAGTSTVEVFGRVAATPEVVEYAIMPDRIVAGTMLCAAAITGGHIRLNNVLPHTMLPILSKLRETGAQVETTGKVIELTAKGRPNAIKQTETLPHPGFPTDMQAQLCALCSIARGTSLVIENVFENRFKHAPELIKLGADIVQKDRALIISGVEHLKGAAVSARDLRGCAALLLAGLAAHGTTVIENAHFIDRGYEQIELSLTSLGADIRRIEG